MIPTPDPPSVGTSGIARTADRLSSAVRDPEALPAGTRIGEFSISHEIGRGATGVVFEALQDPPLGRRVALKVLRLSAMSPLSSDRFRREQRLLAKLGHPAIAQVLDAGTLTDGRPWFAMEFVDGLPIDAYCQRNRLSVRDRLELLAEVCDAVAFAHRRGVIHRDLKPSNVLIGTIEGIWAVKVVDFGVGRIWKGLGAGDGGESDLLTEAGQLIGTLEFLSPEIASQGSRAANPQSDIYSLGSLAYLVLAGGLPIDLGDRLLTPLDERLRRIRLEAPRCASAVARVHPACGIPFRKLRGDIDLVLARSVAKEAQDRHCGAHALASDFRRLAAGDPVSIPGVPVHARLARWIRRNRAPIAWLASLALMLGTATAISIHAALREIAARAEIERALLQAREAHARTEAMVMGAWRAIGPVRNRIQFGADSGRNVGMMRAMRDLFVQVFGPDDPYTDTAVREYARALSAAGDAQAAADTLIAALPGWEARGGVDHPKLVQIRTDIADCLRRAGQSAKAIPILEKVIQQSDALGSPCESPSQAARLGLAACLNAVGRHEEAIATAEEALRRLTLAPPPHPMDRAYMEGVLGDAFRASGRSAEAESVYRELLSTERRRDFEAHPLARLSMGGWAGSLAMMMLADGRPQEARPWLELGLRWLHDEASPVNATARWLRENAGCFGLCPDGTPIPPELMDAIDP